MQQEMEYSFQNQMQTWSNRPLSIHRPEPNSPVGFFVLQILKAEMCSDGSQIQQKEHNSQTESTRHIFTVWHYLEILSGLATTKDEKFFF